MRNLHWWEDKEVPRLLRGEGATVFVRFLDPTVSHGRCSVRAAHQVSTRTLGTSVWAGRKVVTPSYSWTRWESEVTPVGRALPSVVSSHPDFPLIPVVVGNPRSTRKTTETDESQLSDSVRYFSGRVPVDVLNVDHVSFLRPGEQIFNNS